MELFYFNEMVKTIYAYFLMVFLLTGMAPALANGPDRVISTGPSWKSFTNEDGTGLYHEILHTIFAAENIQVVHAYTNANRGVQMVRKGLADIYTCRSDTGGFKDLMLSQYPMYEGQIYAIFKKDRIPQWKGQDSLSQRTVVWRRGYYKAHDFHTRFSILETDSGPTALAQVILGRADFYIDDRNLINESIAQNTLAFSPEAYDVKTVGSRTYHPMFKKSSRGRKIMALYNKGIRRLHQSGRLRKLFKKWGHPYPRYTFAG